MARIRTIKPDFWTDEKVVSLPFEARLLFIGLWNFADDTGAIDYSPDRIRMQIFPDDPQIDAPALLDLLCILEMADRWSDGVRDILIIRHWHDHQKIDNPSRKTISREGYRKMAIPNEVRIAVATKYKCSPGGEVSAECYYCGNEGKIHWWSNSRGKPTRWVTLSGLEFDHFISEHSGGENASNNIVLACRSCNRGKREFDPLQFMVMRNPSIALDNSIESSSLERKGKGLDLGPRTKDLSPIEEERLDKVVLLDRGRSAL